MKQTFKNFFLIFLLIFLISCQNAQVRQDSHDTQTLKTLGESVSGTEIDEQKLKEIAEELKDDPESRSAVEALEDTLSNQNIQVKYCPLTGNRYSADLILCPIHDVELKIVE